MTPEEFAALVREMRAAQTAYFKMRPGEDKQYWLRESKGLERRVDLALLAMLPKEGVLEI